MRIKNAVSKAKDENFIVLIATFLVFSTIDFGILLIALHSGMAFTEIIEWMFSSFLKADAASKFIYLTLLIFPIVTIFMFIMELKSRTSDNSIARNSKNFVQYVDFFNNKIELYYPKIDESKAVYYKDIDLIELVIDTCYTTHASYGPKSVYFSEKPTIRELYINIKSGSVSYSIHRTFIDFNRLFKIIYYSQYVKSFSYQFTGFAQQEAKEKLGKMIDDYIKNGYKKNLNSYLWLPMNEVKVAIAFVFLIIFFVILISILIK